MINMDEQMKIFYSMVHSLDTTQCVEVKKPLDSLELRLGLVVQGLDDFVNKNTKLVCFENYSSKDLLKAHSVTMKDKYVEFTRSYGIITHQFLDNPEMKSKAIGFIDSIYVYNGFPGVINSEMFAEDPKQAFKDGEAKLKLHPIIKMFALPFYFNRSPETYVSSKIFLLKDFYDTQVSEKSSGGK